MKFHSLLLSSVFSLAPLAVVRVSAEDGVPDPGNGNQGLRASLGETDTFGRLRLEIINNSPNDSRYFFLTKTPKQPPPGIDPQLATEDDIFQVQQGSSTAQYLGAQVKRADLPFPNGRVEIPPKGSYVVEFDILPLYDFSTPGTYRVKYNGEDDELACDASGQSCLSSIPSNDVARRLQAEQQQQQQVRNNNLRKLADTFPGCTPAQTADIVAAKADAQKCLKDSCDCLDTLKGDEDNSYFEMFFGDDTKANIDVVKQKFKAIKDDLAGDINYKCATKEECDAVKKANDIPLENVIFGYYKAGAKDTVHLCEGFWAADAKEGKDTKMGVLIHEVSHFDDGANTDDHKYGVEKCKKLADDEPEKARMNADTYEYFCECLPNGGGGAWGDPHFKTWHGSHFDFHGECDLVLLDAPSFDGGRGLRIHVRTQISSNHQYSYVAGLALQIGNDILEVGGHGEYWFNRRQAGDVDTEKKPAGIDGHRLYFATTKKKRHYW
jgi:peptidyl-Lys metalloendopeptidase